MGAIEAWKYRVEAHHEQSESVMAAAAVVG